MSESDDVTEDARCPDCGEPVPIGGWPFCASRVNPQGHARPSYGFSMGSGIRVWEKMSPGWGPGTNGGKMR